MPQKKTQNDGSSAQYEPFILIAYIVIIINFDLIVNENARFSKTFEKNMIFCRKAEIFCLNDMVIN